MNGKKVRILLTGGGSGGHIYPLLAVSEALTNVALENKLSVEVRYLGPNDEYGRLFINSGIGAQTIASARVRRYFSLANVLDLPKFLIGFFQALFKVYWFMPDAVFSKGGTGALPVILAAWFYRIPIMIHESDAKPGLTNLASARFAKRIAVSFEYALQYFDPQKAAWVGTPLRRNLLIERMSLERAKEELGFDSQKPLTIVIGGSLGSTRINEFVLANLEALTKETQILHQTGRSNYESVEKLARTALLSAPLKTGVPNRYLALPYLDESTQKKALTAADLIVSRAGSGTISEIAAFAKPSILIPLPESANDHQRLNAFEYAKTGAAVVIEEGNLLGGVFMTQLRAILGNPDIMNKMSLASSRFFKPQAAEIVAEEIIRLAV